MHRTELRLAHGALALIVAYVCVDILYRSFSAQIFHPPPGSTKLIARGEILVESCTACHYLDQRANFIGPQLVGIIGRPVADADQYDYSSSLRRTQGSWSPERLEDFLHDPQTFAPGTKMSVAGWSKGDAKAIVAYLQSKD